MSELGVFCRKHAFYDCPVCRGEDVVWVIPVVEHGVEVGELHIREDFSTDVIGEIHLPWAPPSFSYAPAQPVVAIHPPIDERANEGLLERVELIFSKSRFDEMLEDPRWAEAAARGRAIHERAEAMVAELGVSYQEALEGILEESE